MAVLVEAISVITRKAAIDAKYPGGWTAFTAAAPNKSLCHDTDLVRIGFMMPQDVETFVIRLTSKGLTFLEHDKACDIAVADQQHGLTTICDWLEFARLPFGNTGDKIAVCWYCGKPGAAAGLYFCGKSVNPAVPPGWSFKGSLSQSFTYVPGRQLPDRYQYIRSEKGVDVYLDRETGREVFVGRSS